MLTRTEDAGHVDGGNGGGSQGACAVSILRDDICNVMRDRALRGYMLDANVNADVAKDTKSHDLESAWRLVATLLEVMHACMYANIFTCAFRGPEMWFVRMRRACEKNMKQRLRIFLHVFCFCLEGLCIEGWNVQLCQF